MNLKRYKLTITARSPLAFPMSKPGTQFRSSLPYVPGAVIYGALGAVLGLNETFDPAVFRLIRCNNAYPVYVPDAKKKQQPDCEGQAADQSADQAMDTFWERPLPMTAIQPKGAESDILDSLVPRVCWEHQQPTALIYAPTDSEGRPWEPASSISYRIGQTCVRDPESKTERYIACLQKGEVSQRVLTRVAINRRRGTAEESRLYSPLVLSEVTNDQPTRFVGSIVVPEAHDDMLHDALKQITHLGGRQTSGLGAVKIEPIAVEPECDADIQARVEKLTARFEEQATLYTALGATQPFEVANTSIFTINLLSDALLLEQGWVPTIEYSKEMLREVTGIEAKLLRSFTTSAIVGGWNVSWQRQKPTGVAVRMGGLYVFQTTHGPLTDDAYKKLAQLQLDGIGERRAEGYGQVRICDDFHIIRWEEMK